MEFVEIPFMDRTIEVATDYWMDQGIRMPVDLREAHRIAAEHGCRLPTPAMVDAIWEHADIKLNPHPLPPTREMTTMKWFKWHNDVIEEQLAEYEDARGKLIAGHKKDIIDHPVSSRKVAIYGWHRLNGRPIQPVNTWHSWNYADYSHGVRLVKKD